MTHRVQYLTCTDESLGHARSCLNQKLEECASCASIKRQLALFMSDPGLALLNLGDLIVYLAWLRRMQLDTWIVPNVTLPRTFYSSWQTQCSFLDWQTRHHTRFLFWMRFQVCINIPSMSFQVTDTQASCTARPKVVHAIEGQGIVHNYFIKDTFGKYLFTMDFTKEDLTISTLITQSMLKLSCSFLLPFSDHFLLIEVGCRVLSLTILSWTYRDTIKLFPLHTSTLQTLPLARVPTAQSATTSRFLPTVPLSTLSLTAGTVKTGLWFERRATAPSTLVKLSIHSWSAEAPDRKRFRSTCSVFFLNLNFPLPCYPNILFWGWAVLRDHVWLVSMSLGTWLRPC